MTFTLIISWFFKQTAHAHCSFKVQPTCSDALTFESLSSNP